LTQKFNDFEKDQSYEHVAARTVKFTEQLELEADAAYVEERLDARGAELTKELCN
jgi:hypothetical protein